MINCDYKFLVYDRTLQACRTVVVAQGDHKSRTVRILFPRFIDGVDVMDVGHAFIHWLAADGSDGISDAKRIEDGDFVVCEWEIWNNVTAAAGDVTFSLHLQTTNDAAEITYALATEDAIFEVRATQNSSEGAYKPVKDELAELMQTTLYTPRINADGVWEIYDYTADTYVSTGISAVGPKGDPGKEYTLTDEDKDDIALIVRDYFVDVSKEGY